MLWCMRQTAKAQPRSNDAASEHVVIKGQQFKANKWKSWFIFMPSLLFADLEWKLIYVGSAESEEHDQVLDDVHVGPVTSGKFKFVLQVCSPACSFLAVAVQRWNQPRKSCATQLCHATSLIQVSCCPLLQASSGKHAPCSSVLSAQSVIAGACARPSTHTKGGHCGRDRHIIDVLVQGGGAFTQLPCSHLTSLICFIRSSRCAMHIRQQWRSSTW